MESFLLVLDNLPLDAKPSCAKLHLLFSPWWEVPSPSAPHIDDFACAGRRARGSIPFLRPAQVKLRWQELSLGLQGPLSIVFYVP